MVRLEKCAIDHERFAYLVSARLQELKLSYRLVSELSGVSTRQISDAVNGNPIGAGSTIMLAIVCGISVDEMFSGSKLERLKRVQSVYNDEGIGVKFQTVTPKVSHETQSPALQEACA